MQHKGLGKINDQEKDRVEVRWEERIISSAVKVRVVGVQVRADLKRLKIKT